VKGQLEIVDNESSKNIEAAMSSYNGEKTEGDHDLILPTSHILNHLGKKAMRKEMMDVSKGKINLSITSTVSKEKIRNMIQMQHAFSPKVKSNRPLSFALIEKRKDEKALSDSKLVLKNSSTLTFSPKVSKNSFKSLTPITQNLKSKFRPSLQVVSTKIKEANIIKSTNTSALESRKKFHKHLDSSQLKSKSPEKKTKMKTTKSPEKKTPTKNLRTASDDLLNKKLKSSQNSSKLTKGKYVSNTTNVSTVSHKQKNDQSYQSSAIVSSAGNSRKNLYTEAISKISPTNPINYDIPTLSINYLYTSENPKVPQHINTNPPVTEESEVKNISPKNCFIKNKYKHVLEDYLKNTNTIISNGI